MTRSTDKTINTITEKTSEFVSQASEKIGELFGTTPDSFTDRMVAKAKAVDAKDFVPSRQTVAKTGTGAGIVLAGAAAVAAGAFAFYYLKERNQEEADYDLIAKEGDFELRRYKPHIAAETVATGDRSEALDKGFRPLADYIFARPGGRAESEADDAKIAMTVPVTVTSEDNRRWTVRFVMPSEYERADLPAPAAGVTISERRERHVATLRFAGKGTDEELVENKRRELVAWINERGFDAVGDPEYAFYNAPIVPGFLRRNEVWVEIEAP